MFIMLMVVYFYTGLVDSNIWTGLLIFLLVPLLQFLITPFFRLIGLFRYLSPMVIVFAPNKKRFDLHNGTSFDYLITGLYRDSGLSLRNKMMGHYIDALLNIVQMIENKEIPETIIVRGSSYFFSARTAEKLGFKVSGTSIPERLNILLNYVDLLWMYSLANDRLQLPDLRNIKTASTSGTELVAHRDQLIRIKNLLNRDRPSI